MIFISTPKNEKSPTVWGHSSASLGLACGAIGLVGTDNGITKSIDCQSDVSRWVSEQGEVQGKFAEKKKKNFYLANSYFRLQQGKKAKRVYDCGTLLEFAHQIDSNGQVAEYGKLHKANFCKDRLCPMCSWRRSYKIFGQVSRIMSVLQTGNYKFLMLTLTVPNCDGKDLSLTVDSLMKAFNRLTYHKPFKRAVQGYFRALEITRNKNNGTYHPHFHCVLVVPSNYAESDLYIDHDKWLKMWRRATKDNSIVSLDIRLAKGKNSETTACSDDLASAVAEIAKYSVKSSDYLIADNDDLTDEIVSTLSSALHHRRLVQFGGLFADIQKALKLDDAEDGDLVHINDSIDPSLAYMIVRYGWSCGAYKMLKCYTKSDPESGVNE